MRSRSYLLISVLAGVAATVQAPASDVRQPQSVSAASETAASVPFDLYQGYFMVVHGSVGPLKNLNFFLDTGTTLPVLDSRIMKKLKLHGEEPTSLVIVGGRVQGEEATLPSLEFGPVQQSNLEVVAADLSFFEKFLPVRIDTIVGIDVLGRRPFVIDYSARVIRFGAAPTLPFSVPLRLDAGLAVFDAEIDQTPVHLLFDTGASSLVLFARATPQGPIAKADAVPQPEAIGNFESKQVRLRSLKLGAEEFRKKTALVTRNPKPSQLDFDGLMSPVALGISQVSVDLAGGVLAFSR
jgi:predicted aspartyl protease